MHTEFQIRSFIGSWDSDWQDPGFHSQQTLEISILLEGRGLFEWNDGKHMLEAGHIVIVPDSISHRFEGFGKSRYALLHLAGIPPRIAELLQKLVSKDKPVVFSLSRLDKDRFERLFREWLRIHSSHLKEKLLSDIAWTEVILLFLLEHSRKDQRALTITNAADYIRENLQHGVQISEMAALAGLSEAGFRRLFEQIYHMSPKHYQQQCRMTEAKWLLSSEDKDIKEIASQIGFIRLHSFSQWFKQIEGISPSEWRKRQQHG
ncbi:AraC family transcriptional regulator [Paenibacillus baekrokdamisoli]|uniref:AraC family transcriptional regulator n=1 Tax=Paenibacillus baekrokdamisoli TaxID=1712516 RepID=A0A3G9JAK0_9BACL|nr:AraC family transcriptional regulator [Paenibacillus baekrokdamisoli]MBB3068064.1 AraC-like DNA-binding protein [Paenibacillus baekrokdamisoli]BBH22891.1 AraC family transcriptional regulator [Paenibacillus baekrokdamisoli]